MSGDAAGSEVETDAEVGIVEAVFERAVDAEEVALPAEDEGGETGAVSWVGGGVAEGRAEEPGGGVVWGVPWVLAWRDP